MLTIYDLVKLVIIFTANRKARVLIKHPDTGKFVYVKAKDSFFDQVHSIRAHKIKTLNLCEHFEYDGEEDDGFQGESLCGIIGGGEDAGPNMFTQGEDNDGIVMTTIVDGEVTRVTYTDLIDSFPDEFRRSEDGQTILHLDNNNGNRLFLSKDGGVTWNAIVLEQGVPGIDVAVSAYAVSQGGTAIIVADDATDTKMMRVSTDDGATWFMRGRVESSFFIGMSAEGVAVSDDGVRLVITSGSFCIYSTNGGGLVSSRVSGAGSSSAFVSGNGQMMIICNTDPGYTQTFVWSSTDGGVRWGVTRYTGLTGLQCMGGTPDGNRAYIGGDFFINYDRARGNWQQLPNEPERSTRVGNVAYSVDGEHVLMNNGVDGSLMISHDACATVTQLATSDFAYAFDISADGQTIGLSDTQVPGANGMGSLLLSKDGGLTFEDYGPNDAQVYNVIMNRT